MISTVIGLLMMCNIPSNASVYDAAAPSVVAVADAEYPEYKSYPEWRPDPPMPERPHLTKSGGVFDGPSGKETYYNLKMDTCIRIMRDMGYSEDEYPYYIREDGAKCLGPYVMCAANLSLRPKGTIVESSLGMAIVVDTGGFAASNPTQLDMCVDW